MHVPARPHLTRRGARSMVRSSTWYPAGSGVGFGVFAVQASGAVVDLSAGPSPAAVVSRCYTGARPGALPGASQHSPRVITLGARSASVTVSLSRCTEAREWALLAGMQGGSRLVHTIRTRLSEP